MDFQLARNLSALARAQEETSQALLHIDSLADCLNREIIMAAASSEATEQLVAVAKTTLLQVQTILATQSEEGASRLRDAQISFITTRRRGSHPVMVIPMRRQPLEETYGVMMSFEAVSGRLINSIGICDLRFVAVRPAGTHFSSVSLI